MQVIDELINRNIVDSATAFCRAIDFDSKSFSHIKTGKRNVPIELIGKLYTMFAGNPIFIVSGKGNLLIEDNLEQPIVQESLTSHNTGDEIKRLNRVIETMISNNQINIKYIKLLEEKIERLERG